MYRAVPLFALTALTTFAACSGRKPEAPGQRPMATGDVQKAALATYVKPGDLDQYYLFYSGGHSGQVFVAGNTEIPPSGGAGTSVSGCDPADFDGMAEGAIALMQRGTCPSSRSTPTPVTPAREPR